MEPQGDRLRIGLLLDSPTVPAWVRRALERVVETGIGSFELVVYDDAEGRDPNRVERARQVLGHALYEGYARLDRLLLGTEPDPFRRVDVGVMLAGIPTLVVRPRRSRFSDTLDDSSVDAIRKHSLDVLLRFGFRILRGPVLTSARHGVWSYHHDDPGRIRGGPPCFWEVIEGHPTTGSVLQVLSERLDGGTVICRSWAPTHRRSVARNQGHVYWKSAAFVARSLKRLADDGELPGGTEYQPYPHRLYRKPASSAFLGPLLRFSARSVLSFAADRVLRSQWFLAYRFHRDASEPPEEPFRFRAVFPPRDRFWADPFPVRHGTPAWFVFFEEYHYARRRGQIVVGRLDPERGLVDVAPALDTACHASYPFLFEWRGALFMLPETAEARQVRLYRCREFPGDWQLEAVLLDGVDAVDATLHEEGGRWWMFVNVAEPGTSHAHDELCLYYAETPLGPWRPHRRNPIVSDARSARPAGRLFRWNGSLYRPAQDCSVRYGRAVAMQRVLRMDTGEYSEETVSRIEPDWRPGLIGTHTWNRGDGLTVIDGLRRIPRLPGPLASGRSRG